ncbi:hypothetical protein [Paraclostridium bifermentans]|uniref:hypothetical protein n=1 Tax=Paraclostridium bifermentans TaxID=1490 RepID=UPI00374F3D16
MQDLNSQIDKDVIRNYLKVNESLKGCNETKNLKLIHSKNKLKDSVLIDVVPRLDDLNLPSSLFTEEYKDALGGDTRFERLIYSCLLVSSFAKQISNKLLEHDIVYCNFDNIFMSNSELKSLVKLFERIMTFRGYLVLPVNNDLYILNCKETINAHDLECVIDAKEKEDIEVEMYINDAINESLVYSAIVDKLSKIPKNVIISDIWVNLSWIFNKVINEENVDIHTLWDACYMIFYLYNYFNCSSLVSEETIGKLQQPCVDNLLELEKLIENKVSEIEVLVSDLKTCQFLLERFDVDKIEVGKQILTANIVTCMAVLLPNFTENNEVVKPRFINEKEMKFILFGIIDTDKTISKPMDLTKLIQAEFNDELFDNDVYKLESIEPYITSNVKEKIIEETNKPKFNNLKLNNINLNKMKFIKMHRDDCNNTYPGELIEEDYGISKYFTCNRYTISIALLLLLFVGIRLITL